MGRKALAGEKPELIAEIAELGHEIGSHTCTHRDLRGCNDLDLVYELKRSKHFLEDVTEKETLGIAYPWFYNSRVLTTTSRYYSYGYTTEYILVAYAVKLFAVRYSIYDWRSSEISEDTVYAHIMPPCVFS